MQVEISSSVLRIKASGSFVAYSPKDIPSADIDQKVVNGNGPGSNRQKNIYPPGSFRWYVVLNTTTGKVEIPMGQVEDHPTWTNTVEGARLALLELSPFIQNDPCCGSGEGEVTFLINGQEVGVFPVGAPASIQVERNDSETGTLVGGIWKVPDCVLPRVTVNGVDLGPATIPVMNILVQQGGVNTGTVDTNTGIVTVDECAPGGGSGATIPVGKMLYVDILGDDATGTRGRFDLPYETPEAAKADAVAGDLIHVGPGDYVITSNLAKDGVDWHLESNVVFTITSDTSFNMFGDEDGAKSYNINGNGLLRTDPTGGGSPVCHVIYISDPASVMSVRCLDILNVGTLAQFIQSDPVHQEGGNLTIECRDIEGRGHGASYPVWWTDGAMSIRARNIRQLSDGSGGVSITAGSVNNPTGECYIKCDVIESTSIGSYAIQQVVFSGADAGSTAKAWIECLEIKGPAESNTQAIVKQSGGNLYITTQKITGGIFSNGDYGDLYINSQKFQGFATDDPTPGIISLSGARSHIAILQTVDGDNGDALVSIGGGEQNVSLGNFTRTNAGHGIEVTGGTLNLNNTRIDTSVDDGSSPLKKSGGELSLNGVELIAESTQKSIAADDAQTVTATGSKCLQAVDANITIEGDLFYDDGTSPSGKVAMSNADGSWSWASLVQTDLQSALDALKVEVFSGVVKYAANATYTIDTSAAFGYTVDTIIIESDSGTVTAALKIGATAITGISAVSVTTSAATGTATAANVVSVGNRLILVLSSNADARNVKYTIKYTRS